MSVAPVAYFVNCHPHLTPWHVSCVHQVEPGDRPNEQYAEFNYTVLDKKTPEVDGNGNVRRTVQMEKSRFLQVSGTAV